MTTTKTIAILIRLAADWRREELQLCKQFGDVIIPQSMRERRIKETKAIDAAAEMIKRLEAAERDVALKERVIDALGSELNAVAKERDELRAKIAEMERQEPTRDWWDCLIADISAIDCMYRGSPTYAHDAYWMRDRVVWMLKKRRDAIPGAKGEEK